MSQQQQLLHDSVRAAIITAIDDGRASAAVEAVEICHGGQLQHVEFSDFVAVVLKETKLTLEQAADRLGCSASTLKKWRYGQNRPWPGRGLRHAVEDLVRLYHEVLDAADEASIEGQDELEPTP